MNRIDATFTRLRKEGRRALVAYLTAGDPDLDASCAAALAAVRAGADVLEIGVPFSDPVADGPVIQAAMQRALAAGGGFLPALELARRVRAESEIPLVLFGYLNPLLWYGVEEACGRAKAAGVDGLLVVDVPAEEAAPVRAAARARELAWIALVTPTTDPQRAGTIVQEASGFVYLVSMTGTTGGALRDPASLQPQIAGLRQSTSLPVCIGFGIRDRDSAQAAARLADGVVVGSALVQALATGGKTPTAAMEELLGQLRAGVDQAGG